MDDSKAYMNKFDMKKTERTVKWEKFGNRLLWTGFSAMMAGFVGASLPFFYPLPGYNLYKFIGSELYLNTCLGFVIGGGSATVTGDVIASKNKSARTMLEEALCRVNNYEFGWSERKQLKQLKYLRKKGCPKH